MACTLNPGCGHDNCCLQCEEYKRKKCLGCEWMDEISYPKECELYVED